MYRGPSRGPCIGIIYTHPSMVGGIQAIISSYTLKYADTHEWVKVEGDSATVGITDHAQVDTFIYLYYCECEA